MNCPHCDSPVPTGSHGCPACGFSLPTLKPILGDQWVRLERITDAVHALPLSDSRAVEILLDDFERQFPQAFIAIYLGQLPRHLKPAELGFWLLNHGAFNTPQVAKRNDFGLIVVIDYTSMACAVSLGYALEGLISQSKVAKSADKLAKSLKKNQLGLGLSALVTQVTTLLSRAGRPESRCPAHHQSGFAADMGLRSLRSGHRKLTGDPEASPRTQQ